MASISKSFVMTSDIMYDYECSPCEENGLNAEAEFYCQQCYKQLCQKCEELHQRLNKAHPVLGLSDRHRWGTVANVALSGKPTEMCKFHANKEIEMYCADHDQILCTICVSANHRLCKVVKHLPEVASGIRKSTKFKNLPAKVGKASTKLNQIVSNREKNRQELINSGQEIVSSIQNLKMTLNQRLEDLERDTVDKLNNILAEFDTYIQDDIGACSRDQEDLDKFLQDTGAEDDSFSYISFKKCQDLLTKADRMATEMTRPDYKVTFRMNTAMKKCLSSASFGYIETSPATCLTNDVTSDHVYTCTEGKPQYCVRTNKDKDHCSITGCCVLPNGNIVLADWRNNNVKLLNEDFVVKANCHLNEKPCDVCPISESEVVVACRTYLQFIDVSSDRLKPTRKINVNKHAMGVAFHDGQLYVGGKDGLYIYTTTGQLVKQLCGDYVYRFAISDDGSRFYITTDDKNVITLNSNGQLVARLGYSCLINSTGVCVASNGVVFTCASNSNNVIQVDQGGQKRLSNVATEFDGVNTPVALCFNRATSQLIVGQDNDNILVLQMQ